MGLRDFKHVSDNNRGNPEGYYFEDRHHDLDKFTGEWEGMGFGNHPWRVHIVVLKKANYYSRYWSDALGLELSITRMVKRVLPLRAPFFPEPPLLRAGGFSGTQRRGLYN